MTPLVYHSTQAAAGEANHDTRGMWTLIEVTGAGRIAIVAHRSREFDGTAVAGLGHGVDHERPVVEGDWDPAEGELGVEVAAEPLLGPASVDVDPQLEDRPGGGRGGVAVSAAHRSPQPGDDELEIEVGNLVSKPVQHRGVDGHEELLSGRGIDGLPIIQEIHRTGP